VNSVPRASEQGSAALQLLAMPKPTCRPHVTRRTAEGPAITTNTRSAPAGQSIPALQSLQPGRERRFSHPAAARASRNHSWLSARTFDPLQSIASAAFGHSGPSPGPWSWLVRQLGAPIRLAPSPASPSVQASRTPSSRRWASAKARGGWEKLGGPAAASCTQPVCPAPRPCSAACRSSRAADWSAAAPLGIGPSGVGAPGCPPQGPVPSSRHPCLAASSATPARPEILDQRRPSARAVSGFSGGVAAGG